MAKKHPGVLPHYSRFILAILCLYLFVAGLSASITVIGDWYQRPDYITDSSSSFFAGGLFLAPGLLLLILPRINQVRSGKISRLFALLAAAWSIFMICLRMTTIADYKNDTRFGVCVHNGRHYSEMYVRDSEWCDHFGQRIKYLSPVASQEPKQ